MRETISIRIAPPNRMDAVSAATTHRAGSRSGAADVTLRAGYHGDRDFGETALEPHAVFSIVWTRRWR